MLVLLDSSLLVLALWTSYSLRLREWAPPTTLTQFTALASAPVIAIPIFYALGLYKIVVSYLPERALWVILQGMTYAAICWIVFSFVTEAVVYGFVPRSVPILYWALGIILLSSSRLMVKALLGGRSVTVPAKVVAIFGAGTGALNLKSAFAQEPGIAVAAFLDDDPNLCGRVLGGTPVYDPSELNDVISRFHIGEIILSNSSLSLKQRQALVEQISAHGVKVRTLPPLNDVAAGRYVVNQIREIDIDELLGRSSVPPEPDLFERAVTGRVVMVTGAGGSIGSELCRIIMRWAPKRLVLFEANEFALYTIEQTLLAAQPDSAVVPVLGSVTDAALLRRAIEEHGVEVLYHAAAHKHVPLLEVNALEGIRNNVLGTLTVAEQAFEAGVGSFVLISSDKAVRPTNVMGATKRWAELIVQQHAEAARRRGTLQKFSAVRFGNVLGSNGSVVPLFKRQIAEGGAITLTDGRMTRYFMSIHEAAELIVQASALSQGGDVFLLEMGEPILIRDLAETMVRLAGLKLSTPETPGDIDIIEVGRRPGEKLYEELFYDPERAAPTEHPRILTAPDSACADNQLGSALDELRRALNDHDEARARAVLFGLIDKAT
ncbi:capsular biosynthesis protein [Devosia sp. Root413D1]|nr:capsular biosynthesis protein [Devosia sp. Root413D1]